jgi:hypothetical protein
LVPMLNAPLLDAAESQLLPWAAAAAAAIDFVTSRIGG